MFDSFDRFLVPDCPMKIQPLHMVNNQFAKGHIANREWQTRITNMRECIGALWICRKQSGTRIGNKDRPHAGIVACTYLFLYGSQLRHATPVPRNYRTGLPRTISRTQQFYSALPGVRRRLTSLPGARYSARLVHRGLLRRRRYSRRPPQILNVIRVSLECH